MADDQNLSADEAENFGAQPQTDAGAAGATGGYIANFDGDEIDGKRYAMGDKIADSVDAGTIAYLVQNGRISAVAAGAEAQALGDSSDPALPNGTSDADALVNDNSKAELLKIAEDEGVEGVTDSNSKAEIAAAIVAARRG